MNLGVLLPRIFGSILQLMAIKERKTCGKFLGRVVVFLLIVMAVTSNVRRAEATNVIYIRENGYVDPPTACISTLDGITYSLTDNINSSIVIERHDIIVDGNWHTLSGSGNLDGFSLTNVHNVTVKDTNIKGFLYGIALTDSERNHLTRNNITENVWAGILLRAQNGHSNNNSITGNFIHHNFCGIKLDAALMDCVDFNEITGNDITSNSVYGIYLDSCFNNRIFHNTFTGNQFQIISENSVNIWDNGYPSGGNCWSDYTGTDTRHGQYQNETGKDDIGDSPYMINANNKDAYPLMTRYLEIHDIALRQVLPSQTQIQKGNVMNVTVVIENQGNSTETSNITLNANATLISIVNVCQNASTVESYIFVWNTTSYPAGNYTLTAIADQVPGETDTLDNTLTSDPVQVTFTEFEATSYLSTVPVDRTLLVNITIAYVSNLTLWQFTLYFENSILNCTDAVEGPFLMSGGDTAFTSAINNSFNATHGVVLARCSFLGNGTLVEEGGTLATLSFTTLAEGNATINLRDTSLQGNQLPPQPITHRTVDDTILVTFTEFDVTPFSSTVPVGSVFHVDVNVAYVSNLTIWQFDLFFDNSILNCTDAVEGSFLKTFGSTSFAYSINNQYNTTFSMIQVGCFLVGTAAQADGSGTLATVTLATLAQGNTTLGLCNTGLEDNQLPPQPIPHRTVDGAAYVVDPTHDVAVNSLRTYKTVVGRGYVNNFTVTVQNKGFFSETFNITIYADSTPICTEQTTLDAGKSAELRFWWNTSSCRYGGYMMRAYAWPVTGENSTANNEYADGVIDVLKPGDVREDFGKIDMKDVSYVARRFSITQTDMLWDPNADIDSNGKIDMRDIAITAKNFGMPY